MRLGRQEEEKNMWGQLSSFPVSMATIHEWPGTSSLKRTNPRTNTSEI